MSGPGVLTNFSAADFAAFNGAAPQPAAQNTGGAQATGATGATGGTVHDEPDLGPPAPEFANVGQPEPEPEPEPAPQAQVDDGGEDQQYAQS